LRFVATTLLLLDLDGSAFFAMAIFERRAAA
jgi:hypothetical protein